MARVRVEKKTAGAEEERGRDVTRSIFTLLPADSGLHYFSPVLRAETLSVLSASWKHVSFLTSV